MTGMIDCETILCGERVRLLPERAMFWPRGNVLLVADAHFGKAAAFRSAGVLVPRGTTAHGTARLDSALARTRAKRVLFLGDLLHAKEGRVPAMIESLARWRAGHADVVMTLVRGNHDRTAGDPPPELDIGCMDAPIVESPFVFTHRPGTSADGYVICGHVHPAADLFGPAMQRERLPCFWFGRDCAVLPAFGDFTGLADLAAAPGDRIFVVADGEVLEIPARR